jgi:hypothetical protein
MNRRGRTECEEEPLLNCRSRKFDRLTPTAAGKITSPISGCGAHRIEICDNCGGTGTVGADAYADHESTSGAGYERRWRWKKNCGAQGRAELEKLPLAPWASRRRKELLELLDRPGSVH